MKKTLLAALSAALLTTSAQADTVGLYIGGQVWDNEVTGIFGESGHQVDFNLSDEQQGSFFIAVEHPFPFIPNAKISTLSLETNGTTILASDIDFGGKTFASGSSVDSTFDLSYTDYTLYYEIFDNDLLTFDLGVTARDFTGDVSVSTMVEVTPPDGDPTLEESKGTIDTEEFVAMLYVSTKVGLPLTGLSVFGEGNFMSLDDHTLYDYQVGLSYDLINNVAVDLNVTLGYRTIKLELEDLDNLYSDLEFKGAFAGIIVHF